MVGWQRHLQSLVRQVGKTVVHKYTKSANFSSSSASSSSLEAGLPHLRRLCVRPYSPTLARPLYQYFQQLGISSSRNLLAEEAPISSPLTPRLASSAAKAEEHNQKSLTKPSTVQAVLKGIKQGVGSHLGCRYFRIVRTSDCYASREQGLLRPIYILIVRDVIRSCFERLASGVFTVSFEIIFNGLSYSLGDGTDPIIPELGIGVDGGLYLLLKDLLNFDDRDPILAILFFKRLSNVVNSNGLERLLEDFFVKGETERVRSIGLLYQYLTNFAPTGRVYSSAQDGSIHCWEECIGCFNNYNSYRIIVAECIKSIPILHIKIALLAFHDRNVETYRHDDVAACIKCMRNGCEHCNQFSTSKRRVPIQLPLKEAIWGLNEAFHFIYPPTQAFLNENPHLIILNFT